MATRIYPSKQAPRLALGALKTFTGMEGQGFNADLYYCGNKVAFVIDDASGGPIVFQWGHYDDEVALKAYLAHLALPETTYGEFGDVTITIPTNLDILISEIVDDIQLSRAIVRLSKKHVLFRLPGDAQASLRTLTHRGDIDAARREVLTRYPQAHIVDA